jgi:hypothetical protein
MVHHCFVTTHKDPSNVARDIPSQVEALEITMKLESAPMGESSSGISQIMNQQTSLSL